MGTPTQATSGFALVANYDVFLAYPAAERDAASELYAYLNNRLRVFWDRPDLTPGESWGSQLLRAQQNSRSTVALVSQRARDSFYLESEIHQAISQYRADRKHLLIPVYLDGVPGAFDWSIYGINHLQGLDLTQVGTIEGVGNRIVSVLDPGPRSSTQTSEILSAHFLDRFPDYPTVLLEQIPSASDLLRDFAITYGSSNEARLLLAEANRYRREQDPESGIVETYKLPDPANGIFDFWLRAFVLAGLQGPRMIAALLLRANDRHFSKQGQEARASLIRGLLALNDRRPE